MHKKIKFTYTLRQLVTLTFLCLTFSYAISDDSKPESQDSFIHVCRPSSFVRHTQRPDFFVKGALVGDIASGSKSKFSVQVGDKYALKTQTNIFMFRFKDESLFQGEVTTKEDIYLIVKGQLASPAAVISQVFGGAIVESIRQNSVEAPSGDWIVDKVTQAEFESLCKDIN
jgi:hypothetical protein